MEGIGLLFIAIFVVGCFAKRKESARLSRLPRDQRPPESAWDKALTYCFALGFGFAYASHPEPDLPAATGFWLFAFSLLCDAWEAWRRRRLRKLH